MQKQQQLQEFHKQKENSYNIADEEEPQIGTQILDPTLPSDLDFDKKSPSKNNLNEQVKFQNTIALAQPHRKSSLEGVELLQSYTVKGKNPFNMEPKYERGILIDHLHEELIEVKLFDEQNTSSGFKRFWEAVVGYTKRQIAFSEGYFYIFERRKQGLFVNNSWKLSNLFKIFIDEEEGKIRFVFTLDERIITKDMGVKNIKFTMQRLLEQMTKVGLRLQGQS